MIVKRKCIATNKIKNVNELIRIVKTKDGHFFVDSNEKGRGAYISKDKTLIKNLFKNKLLNRVFKCQVPYEIYEVLKNKLEALNEKKS